MTIMRTALPTALALPLFALGCVHGATHVTQQGGRPARPVPRPLCAATAAGHEPSKTDPQESAPGAAAAPVTSAVSPGLANTYSDRWTRQPAEFKCSSAVLKGMIFIPTGETAVPGVVILGGSERGPRTRVKERLAEHFAGARVAALVYDSPGTGQSSGNASLQTRDARAAEAITAVRYLQSQSRIVPHQVGILGVSEGALVTMLAAQDASVAFAIPISGGFGIPMTELARYRIELQGLGRGLNPEEIQKTLLLEEILFALMAGPDILEWRLVDLKAAQWPHENWDELVAAVKEVRQATSPTEQAERWNALRRTMQAFRAAPWFDLVVVDVDRFDRFMAMDAAQFYAFLEQNPLAIGDFDKVRQELNAYPNVRCPVLAVWGEHDDFLPPHRSAAFLKNCLSRAGHPDATVRIVPDASHILTRAGDERRFVDGFPDLLTDWLWQRFPAAPSPVVPPSTTRHGPGQGNGRRCPK